MRTVTGRSLVNIVLVDGGHGTVAEHGLQAAGLLQGVKGRIIEQAKRGPVGEQDVAVPADEHGDRHVFEHGARPGAFMARREGRWQHHDGALFKVARRRVRLGLFGRCFGGTVGDDLARAVLDPRAEGFGDLLEGFALGPRQFFQLLLAGAAPADQGHDVRFRPKRRSCFGFRSLGRQGRLPIRVPPERSPQANHVA